MDIYQYLDIAQLYSTDAECKNKSQKVSVRRKRKKDSPELGMSLSTK